MKLFVLFQLLLLLALSSCAGAFEDPYKTLGVKKGASMREIKRAYKEKAKEWHPDKNEAAEAGEKFREIADAYQLLSDPVRKERYDRFGTYDEPRETSHYGGGSTFDQFFGGAFGGFDPNANNFFQKHRMTLRGYQNTIIGRSHQQPYIIFAWSNWCHMCRQLEPVWESVVNDLEPLGYGIGTINAAQEGTLLERLRISRLPTIVVVVEGRVIHFRGVTKPKDIRVFARDAIPSSFVYRLSDHGGLKRFLDQWAATNKVSVLMFGTKDKPPLRSVLAAMKYATFVRFAYIFMAPSDRYAVEEMKEALGIRCDNCESLLVFNEFPENGPIARLTSSNQLTAENINSLIENNKYLTLPRLSSQEHLDELCPASSRNSRRLCAILVVRDQYSDQTHVAAMRDFVLSRHYAVERIRFAYVCADKQKAFLSAFDQADGGGGSNNVQEETAADDDDERDRRDVMIVWRMDETKARFSRLRAAWSGVDGKVNASADQLHAAVDAFLKGSAQLDDRAALHQLIDEHRPSWFTQLARRTARLWEQLLFHVSKEEYLPALSAVGTLVVILIVGYALNYAAGGEQRSRQRAAAGGGGGGAPGGAQQRTARGSTTMNGNGENPLPTRTPSTRTTDSARPARMRREYEQLVHELRAETYFGLIRLLKPGCRSLIVLVDEETKDSLLPDFCRHIWPWRNNKTLSFGFLMVNKNLQWFRKLLEHTLPVDEESDPSSASALMYKRLKDINRKQTVGTVLSLCGWKLYFSMYHPMHGKQSISGSSRRAATANNYTAEDEQTTTSGSDSEPSTKEEIEALKKRNLKVEDVLAGLPNWLDRLFEGSVTRYYVPEWPENLK